MLVAVWQHNILQSGRHAGGAPKLRDDMWVVTSSVHACVAIQHHRAGDGNDLAGVNNVAAVMLMRTPPCDVYTRCRNSIGLAAARCHRRLADYRRARRTYRRLSMVREGSGHFCRG